MKIAAAQYQSLKGDIQQNIEKHLHFIRIAVEKKVNLIVFPELSLTGYEPRLAHEMALSITDNRLDCYQKLSNENEITICVGAPLKQQNGIQIALFIFQPNARRISYAKQLLHADEVPYFMPGKSDLSIQLGSLNIVPAICYEAMQAAHVKKAIQQNADYYLVSVAKDQIGMEKLDSWFTQVLTLGDIEVLVVNSVGDSEGFISGGKSGVWTHGNVSDLRLDEESEGIIIFSTETGSSESVYL